VADQAQALPPAQFKADIVDGPKLPIAQFHRLGMFVKFF
jgi:hypothetical protein